jgi:hypothetical protein
MNKLVSLMAVVMLTMAFSAHDPSAGLPKSVQKGLKRFYQGNEEVPSMVPWMVPDSLLAGQTLHGSFFHIADTLSQARYLYMGRVFSCRAEGCTAEQGVSQQEASEYFDYYLLFNDSCAVLHVEIYLYQATHGHGVTARRWLQQFAGYNGTQSLIPGKTVDGISGATISVNAITADIISTQQLVVGLKQKAAL